MNCKYCNAELVDGKPFCPSCGKEQAEAEEICVQTAEVTEETVPAEEVVPAEETAAPEAAEETASEETAQPAEAEETDSPTAEIKEGIKATPGKIALAVVAGIVVLAILISLIVSGLNTGKTDDAEPTEEAVEVTMPSNGDPTSALCKGSYTVSDEEAAKTSDVVVATVGDRVLTNAQLQAFYWQEVYLFLQEYGGYAMYVLDYYTPLDQQTTPLSDEPMSWQQFFLESAVYSWHNYQSLALEAESLGYELPAERQAELDSLPADMEASIGSFASVDEMVKYNVGAACTYEAYLEYVDLYYHGLSYYYDYCDTINPTDDEIAAYYAENEEYYTENGITKDTQYVDVRHVLLQPEGGEVGEDGYPVFTDEAWEACRIQAEEIYEQWKTGDLSEDSFAQLAMDHSVDGNASTGGLYENVYEGQMVEEFENWCFDESRQVGDHGLVKTVYGYHIMFFSATRDAWYINAQYDLIDQLSYDFVPEMMEKYPMVVDYSLIALGDLNLT